VAVVVGCAEVTIIAGNIIGEVKTASSWVAGVCSARVVVVTVGQTCMGALTPFASVADGACATIITRRVLRAVLTLTIFLASVGRTNIAIIAIEERPRKTRTVAAGIVERTAISIVAGAVDVGMEATIWTAHVRGTWVLVAT